MSTFLQLCQRVRQECGVAGDGPASVLNQVGVLKKIVDRTQRAWVDIQASRPYWKFARNQTTFVLTPGTREYSIVDDLAVTSLDRFDRDATFLFEVDGNDEKALDWITYSELRARYRTFPDGRPTKIYEGRNRTIGFERTPDKAYTLTLDYWMTPELLGQNADEPSLPEHLQDVIVWKSVMMFAGNETATELYQYAKSMYTPIYLQLVADQGEMPPTLKAYPLATGSHTISSRGFS
jgi:hypothetical protein